MTSPPPARLRERYGRALSFENHFLEVFRDVLLEDLARPPELPAATQWPPVETGLGARVVFFLECPPEAAREWAVAGLLSATERSEGLLVSTSRCPQVAAVRMLGRVVNTGVAPALTASAQQTRGRSAPLGRRACASILGLRVIGTEASDSLGRAGWA